MATARRTLRWRIGQSGRVTILTGNSVGAFNTFATYEAGSGSDGHCRDVFGAATPPSLAVTTSAGLLVFPASAMVRQHPGELRAVRGRRVNRCGEFSMRTIAWKSP